MKRGNKDKPKPTVVYEGEWQESGITDGYVKLTYANGD